jgi:hypothetical protein
MAEMFEIPVLERPSFFDGQRLTAGDLAAVQHFQRELRWLHNRSLHGWGVAFGYGVDGDKGDRAVTVHLGLAIDCKGRELVLGGEVVLPVPAVAGTAGGKPATYYLTVAYAADTAIEPELREGLCDSRGAVRRPERPLLRWQLLGSLRAGLDVVLATVLIRNCALAKPPSILGRRSLAPRQEPTIRAGQTIAGQTQWRRWPKAENPAGVAATVSTRDAGFRTTPRYHAHVVGERGLKTPLPFARASVDGYAHITDATPRSFDLRVILPGPFKAGMFTLNPTALLQSATFLDLLESKLKWHVVWLGVEG